MAETYKSRVYTDRPAYADFDAPAKFQAIQSIIAKRLKQHPNAICSYSGGADSDILLDLIERKALALIALDEAETLHVIERKLTKSAAACALRREQPLFLVVAQRLGRQAVGDGERADGDLHSTPPLSKHCTNSGKKMTIPLDSQAA